MASSRRVKCILASASLLVMYGPSSFGATDTWAGMGVPANTFTYPTGTALWDTSTANWSNGGSGVYTVGDSVVFTDNFSGDTNLALATASLNPSSMEFKHVAGSTTPVNYVLLSTYVIQTVGGFSGSSTTPWGAVQTPAPTLTLDAGFNGSVELQSRAASVSDLGSTTIDGGTLIVDDGGAFLPFTTNNNPNVTLGGGTLEINVTPANNSNSKPSSSQMAGNLTVTATSTLENGAGVENASASGAPHLWNGNLILDAGTTLFFNSLGTAEDWLAATVTVSGAGSATMSLGTTSTTLVMESAKQGSGAVAYNIGTGSGILRNRLAATGTITLGSLIGSSSTSLQGSETTSSGTISSYQIGGLNTNTTFAGTVLDNGVGTTALIKVGTGTLTLSNSANTFSGGTTVNNGTLLETAASGTPFGVGSIAINAGDLALAPTGSGSAVTITGASALAGTSTSAIGSELTYGGGGTLSLNRGSQTSLTFNVGNSGDVAGQGTVIFTRSGQGTMVIAPAGGTGTGNLGMNEILLANSTSAGVYPTTVNGIVNTSIVGQNNDANLSGDFLNYDTVKGFILATYGDMNFGTPSATTTELVNTAQTGLPSTQVFALNASANIGIGSGNTLTIGNDGTGAGQSPQAGLILNDGATISGSGAALAFGAAEGTVYTSAANGTIAVPITGNGGLTLFGPGTLTSSGNNVETGTTNVQAGTLILTGDNTGDSTAAQNVNTGATLQLQANAGNTTGGINRAISTSATQLKLSNGATLQLRADAPTTFVDLGTSTAVTSNISLGNGATVTIDVNRLTSAGSNVALAIDPTGFNVGGATINVTGGNGYSLTLPTITSVTNNTIDEINAVSASVNLTGFSSTVAAGGLGLGGSMSSVVSGVIGNGSGTASVSMSGTGTWALTASNTYTGGTVLNGGVLSLQNASALGPSGTVTFEGGTLQYTTTNTVDYSGRIAIADGSTANIDTNGQNVTFASSMGFFPAHPGKTGGLEKLGAGTLNITATNSFLGLTTVNGGTLALGITGALLSGNNVANNAALQINATNTLGNVSGTGTTTVAAGQTLTANNFSQGGLVNNGITQINGNGTVGPISGTGTLSIGTGTSNNTLQLAANSGLSTQGGLSVAAGSSFDVNNNHVIVNYGSGTDPISSIAALLKTGYNGGSWNGVGGIVSSAAHTNNATAGNLLYGVGYADSADSGNPAGLASGTLEIKYTLLGDANLSGVVDGTDFGIVAANFNKGVTGWDQGDFNYDNVVDGTDFGDLAANFNKGASGAAVGGPAIDNPAIVAFAEANGLMADLTASVPEPASLGLLTLGAVGILARRRRLRK